MYGLRWCCIVNIHDGRNKLNGLLAEYRSELDHDRELLSRVLQAYDQEDSEWKLLCFATCAFNKVEDEFENDNLEGSPDMKLSKPQKKFIRQYLAKVSSSNILFVVCNQTILIIAWYKRRFWWSERSRNVQSLLQRHTLQERFC